MIHKSLGEGTKLGLAYGPAMLALLAEHAQSIDYVEVPFELICHDPSVLQVSVVKPVVLHCASLSIAGTVPPSEDVVEGVRHAAEVTGTPWVGEHLSFVSAECPGDSSNADAYAPGEPYNIGFTVSPPMNDETVGIVLSALASHEGRLPAPLLLENAPLYFKAPGSNLSQVEFISRICERSSVGLLLDLAHFFITSKNLGFDPFEELVRLPLERVVEVHVSGVSCESGIVWDNHAARAPAEVLELLGVVLRRGRVSAVTLEYNWSAKFPARVLLDEIRRVRELIG